VTIVSAFVPRRFDIPIADPRLFQVDPESHRCSPLELCLFPPVLLDYHLNDSGGYDVGRLPKLVIAAAFCFSTEGAAQVRFDQWATSKK